MQGKSPLLAIGVEEASITLYDSPALARARLLPLTAPGEGINPAKMLIAHMKLHKDKGLVAKLASAVVSVPGLMQNGLEKVYKDNLF